jgi:hypothetical protein
MNRKTKKTKIKKHLHKFKRKNLKHNKRLAILTAAVLVVILVVGGTILYSTFFYKNPVVTSGLKQPALKDLAANSDYF